MTWLFLFFTAPIALLWVAALGATVLMVARIRILSDFPAPTGPKPRITVVSPACNEAESLEASLRSWLRQDDVELEIVVVNDRSTDDTRAVLDRVAAEEPRLRAVHNDALPEGWLGKVHALHRGVPLASGDWLLFADADVRLAPGTLARAVDFAEREKADLISVYPEIESAGLLGDATWSAIGATAGLAGLWRSRDPESDKAFATGAFILIRASAFKKTPGFEWLKLEVADDQALALLLKSHGFRCDLVNGRGLVQLAWYTSLRDMVVKSQKNWFGIMGRFSWLRCTLLAVAFLYAAWSPLAVLLPGVDPALGAVPLAGQLAFYAAALIQARWSRRPLFPVLLAPLGLVLLAFMIFRSGLIGRRVGGIEWRGVLYPSSLLRDVQRFRM